MKVDERSYDFETAMAELEKVVQELEGEARLEHALELFDRGMKLSQSCEKFLSSAEQKIEILKKLSSGELSPEPFAQTAADQ